MGWFLMWQETAVPAEKPRSHIEIDGNIQWSWGGKHHLWPLGKSDSPGSSSRFFFPDCHPHGYDVFSRTNSKQVNTFSFSAITDALNAGAVTMTLALDCALEIDSALLLFTKKTMYEFVVGQLTKLVSQQNWSVNKTGQTSTGKKILLRMNDLLTCVT